MGNKNKKKNKKNNNAKNNNKNVKKVSNKINNNTKSNKSVNSNKSNNNAKNNKTKIEKDLNKTIKNEMVFNKEINRNLKNKDKDNKITVIDKNKIDNDFVKNINYSKENYVYKDIYNKDFDKEKTKDLENLFLDEDKKIKQTFNMWKLITLLLIIAIGLLLYRNYTINKDLKEKNAENIENQESDNNDQTYLLLGDSLFDFYNTDEFFKGLNVINSGINGITALDMSKKLDEKVYKYNPTKVFILLGTNDIHFDYTPLETFNHVKEIIEDIKNHNENIEIYVMSLLPINSSDDEKIDKYIYEHRSNEKINEVNEYLEQYCKENDIEYINTHDILVDNDGNLKLDYTKEGLHITDLGYYHITMELLKYF